MNILNFPKADECINQALVISKKLGHHEQVQTFLMNLGSSYGERREFEKASAIFQQAVDLNRSIHSENNSNERTALSLSKLGDNYIELEDYNHETNLLKESLNMYREVYSEEIDHPDIETILNVLGVTYIDWGKPETSIKYLQQAVKMARSFHGDDNQSVASNLYNLCIPYLKLGNHDATRHNGQEALNIYHQISPEHDHVTKLHEMLNLDD